MDWCIAQGASDTLNSIDEKKPVKEYTTREHSMVLLLGVGAGQICWLRGGWGQRESGAACGLGAGRLRVVTRGSEKLVLRVSQKNWLDFQWKKTKKPKRKTYFI